MMIKKISLIVLTTLLIGCSKNENATILPETPEFKITIINETVQNYLGRPSVILQLSLKDGVLPVRTLSVRITKSNIPEKGALVLSTGGFGDQFYGTSFQKNTTIDFALSNGLQVLEIKWDGERGWGTNLEGAGYTLALRGYTQVVKWLKANRIIENSLLISHGGSGGAMQIAYGLTNFNLEDVIDYGILVAGPPTSDLDRAIFGSSSDVALWPNGIGGFGITDYIQGWRANGDYCVLRPTNPPAFVLETLEAESLVNTSGTKDYNYGTTKLFFVNTNDVTNADQQGLLYYNVITSEKEWTFLPNETSHDVGGIEAGAVKIRAILQGILN